MGDESRTEPTEPRLAGPLLVLPWMSAAAGRYMRTTTEPPSRHYDEERRLAELIADEWWKSEAGRVLAGDLAALVELRTAVRVMYEARGDDRCKLDLQRIYRAAGLDSEKADDTMPPEDTFIRDCRRFYRSLGTTSDRPSWSETVVALEHEYLRAHDRSDGCSGCILVADVLKRARKVPDVPKESAPDDERTRLLDAIRGARQRFETIRETHPTIALEEDITRLLDAEQLVESGS